MSLNPKVQLYVGVTAGVNQGMVTDDEFLLGGATKPIGWTIEDVDGQNADDYIEAVVGTSPGRNDGIVTKKSPYGAVETKSIGYLSRNPILDGTELFVGIGPHGLGIVTNSRFFLGEPTDFFGYSMPDPRVT